MGSNRRYPAGQSVDAEYAFHHWMTLYMMGYDSVEPQLKRAGIMEEAPTPGKNYHVPIPPLGTGEDVELEDGQEWPAGFQVSGEVKGAVVKKGPKGLVFTEDDLLETNLPTVSANVMALGRSEKLYEDKRGARALEAGLTVTGVDNVPIISTQHLQDPRDTNSPKQVNSYNLALSPDAVLQVAAGFRKLKTESGDPVFGEDTKFTLMVPPSLQPDAEKTLDRQIVGEALGVAGAGVTNVAYKKAALLVVPQLTDATRWWMVVNNMARKAILKVTFRAMQRFQLGPESDLWKSKQMMKIFSNEKTDYRLVDYRLVASSKP
jgi:hypothetical protein